MLIIRFKDNEGLTFRIKLKMIVFPTKIGTGAYHSGDIPLHRECNVGLECLGEKFFIIVDNRDRVIPGVHGKALYFELENENKEKIQKFLANTIYYEYKTILTQPEVMKAKAILN